MVCGIYNINAPIYSFIKKKNVNIQGKSAQIYSAKFQRIEYIAQD
jgi:hypothetical protein